MSRRDYPVADRYEERQSDFYRRPRQDRNYEDLDIDIKRYEGPAPSRRAETVVKERDTVVSERRGGNRLDFLKEDYGRSSNAGQLVVRERKEEDVISRAPTRRRSSESVRSSRAPPPTERFKEKIVIKERDRSPPYPRSERDTGERDEIVFRERIERARPPPRREEREEKIDITIREEKPEWRPPPREQPIEEIRFRRGGGERPAPPPELEKEEITIRERTRSAAPRSEVDKEEITFRERSRPPPREIDREEIIFREQRSPPPREYRGRDVVKEEIKIREERSMPPRERSQSRGALVARDREEWIVRRRREPSPPPPPREYEREQIIIRRKERTPSPEPEPEPPREPTPEPPPPPPPEPIYRPPIIQEIITHHRHIDHGVERARDPTPSPSPPPPEPPSPPKEENLEIEIRRQGTRGGRAYDENIIFEKEYVERKERDEVRETSRRRSLSASTRRRSPSPVRRRFEDDIGAEAEFYNRRVASRGYHGEAWNGATRDWGLVDIPPGTQRVQMDGAGGGRQEITWERYNGERRGKFIAGDRLYEGEFANGLPAPPSPAPEPPKEEIRETKITRERTIEEKPKPKERMWTEITKDLVIKEAIEEMGYEYEETDEFFYVIDYLKYENVLRLVELTEEIRRERRERIREIQWEREEQERLPKMLTAPPPAPAPPRSKYDERIYEREYIYDRDRRRPR